MRFSIVCATGFTIFFSLSAICAEPKNFQELRTFVDEKVDGYESYSMDFEVENNVQRATAKYGGKIWGKGSTTKTDFEFFDGDTTGSLLVEENASARFHYKVNGQSQVLILDTKTIEDVADQTKIPQTRIFQNFMAQFTDPTKVLEQFEKYYDVSFEGKEKLDRADMYVFNARFNKSTADVLSRNPMWTYGISVTDSTKVYVSVEDGIVRKIVTGDPAKPSELRTFSNIKTNLDLPESTVQLDLPVDVPEMDVTEMVKNQNLGNL